ncbi:MAG: GNAT family N-acetyltransferase [Hyphomicrobiales bacterium]|nr:GNAT family N-acetyltransferase [Hyphomicrobiales bacterium]MDE2113893.1 GNAT family N-acetyltransferase [Hyphomicrobiales bacterium]
MLTVPEWFGPSELTADVPSSIVGLRELISDAPAQPVKRSSNGWRYVAAGQTFLVESVDYLVAATHFDAWIALTHRAVEPNVFLDPCFILPAVQHFAMARRPAFLLVWDESEGDRRRLVGLAPVMSSRSRIGSTVAVTWMHEMAALGTPLIDRERSIETIDLMFDWMQREQPEVTGLLLPKLRRDGAIAALLKTRSLLTGRELREFDLHERAVLRATPEPESNLKRMLSPRKAKNLRRQRHRLTDQGDVRFVSARSITEVRAATEQFLALEAQGWKAKRGTALLNDPGSTTFTRTMSRLLARQGKCRIDALTLDGVPIAMGIVLRDDACAYLWKIAFDETYANTSPGVQFMIEFSKAQSAEEGLHFTDSCAIPDHPMIDHIWRDRMEMVDLLVSTKTHQTRNFALHALAERMRRRMREHVKTAYLRIMNHKRS